MLDKDNPSVDQQSETPVIPHSEFSLPTATGDKVVLSTGSLTVAITPVDEPSSSSLDLAVQFTDTSGQEPRHDLGGVPLIMHDKRDWSPRYDGLAPVPNAQPIYYTTIDDSGQAQFVRAEPILRKCLFADTDSFSGTPITDEVDGDNLVVMPPLSRNGIWGDTKPFNQEFRLGDGSLIIVLWQSGDFITNEISLDTYGPRWDGKLATVVCAIESSKTGRQVIKYYIPLVQSVMGHPVGSVSVPHIADRVQLALPVAPIEIAELALADPVDVVKSVRATSSSSDLMKKYWQQILTEGKLSLEILNAITEGLANA